MSSRRNGERVRVENIMQLVRCFRPEISVSKSHRGRGKKGKKRRLSSKASSRTSSSAGGLSNVSSVLQNGGVHALSGGGASSCSSGSSSSQDIGEKTSIATLLSLAGWRVRRAGEIARVGANSAPKRSRREDAEERLAEQKISSSAVGIKDGSARISAGGSEPEAPAVRVRLLSEEESHSPSRKARKHSPRLSAAAHNYVVPDGASTGSLKRAQLSEDSKTSPPVRLLSDDIVTKSPKRKLSSGPGSPGHQKLRRSNATASPPKPSAEDTCRTRITALGEMCPRMEATKRGKGGKQLVTFQLVDCADVLGLVGMKLSVAEEQYKELVQRAHARLADVKMQSDAGSVAASDEPLSGEDLVLVTAFSYLVASGSLYWGFGPRVYEYVRDELSGAVEAYASPFNHTLPRFCSPFSLDRFFGSLGSFYDVDWQSVLPTLVQLEGGDVETKESAKRRRLEDGSANEVQEGGRRASDHSQMENLVTIIANPPYIEAEIQFCADFVNKIGSIFETLNNSTEESRRPKKDLLILSICPDWRPAPCIVSLQEAASKVYERVLPPKQHGYYNYQSCEFVKATFPSLAFGFQWLKKGNREQEEQISNERNAHLDKKGSLEKVLGVLFKHMGEDPRKHR
ncbi:unnamed protein product [Amoebophrya sp. A25]|nr:unnamed protein product [Amoebophrya sp. A25]|eukprot:GSA25T00016265001.1